MSLTDGKKPRMRTADEIFKRLKWDAACPVQPENATIGYEDRFLGIMEININEFEDPDADIPFHRIRYFRTTDTGEVFWDRRRRIDTLTSGFASLRVAPPAASQGPGERSPPRSGRQKKKLLQQKRLERREEVKVQLVGEILEDDDLEQAQALVLPEAIASAQRQQQRLRRETGFVARPREPWHDGREGSAADDDDDDEYTSGSTEGSHNGDRGSAGAPAAGQEVLDEDVALFM